MMIMMLLLFCQWRLARHPVHSCYNQRAKVLAIAQLVQVSGVDGWTELPNSTLLLLGQIPNHLLRIGFNPGLPMKGSPTMDYDNSNKKHRLLETPILIVMLGTCFLWLKPLSSPQLLGLPTATALSHSWGSGGDPYQYRPYLMVNLKLFSNAEEQIIFPLIDMALPLTKN